MSGTRNFNLGTRNMSGAAQIALGRSAENGLIGETTVADIAGRFTQFVDFAKAHGVGRLERITGDLVLKYGKGLAGRVDSAELKPGTAQNLVSAVNAVMVIVTSGDWKTVGPVADCGISQRSAIRLDIPPGLDREVFAKTIAELHDRGLERQVAIAELARELGLRSKEGALLDAQKAFSEATKVGVVTISLGTKGGLDRIVSITSEKQLATLEKAANVQGNHRSIMPPDKNWKEWRNGELRVGREIVQEISGGGYHDLRAAYACERYHELTGHRSPVENGGKMAAERGTDREARMQIAQELGHGRIDVVSEYIGGR
jgi:hypothetical protein